MTRGNDTIFDPPERADQPRKGLSRRAVLKSSAFFATLGLGLTGRPLVGFASSERHGLSVFGELKYVPDFAHFDYINPAAPKGGKIALGPVSWNYNQNPQTFNTLNGFVLRGDAPPMIELLFDTLMVRAYDEPDAVYCHLARSVALAPNGSRMTFTLRPEARFHDGTPVTADDVVFSYRILKEKGHPVLQAVLKDIDRVEIEDGTIVFHLAKNHARQGVLDAASIVPIFAKAQYDDKTFGASSLKPPVGSGPYRVASVNPGSSLTLERDPAYWAAKLPTAVGHYNFGTIEIVFTRDQTVLFEAFKKGDITYFEDFSSTSWATRYDFPAIKDRRVQRLEIPDHTPSGAQGWFFNTRRAKFADKRTRQAIALAFDFEWSNKQLFHGLYQRTASFFERSAMKAEGLPTGAELALLERYRATLDPDVFKDAYSPPTSDGSGKDRALLRKAFELLKEAGWTKSDKGLTNAAGDVLSIELLANSPLFERIVTPWAANLERLGIPLTFRLVDPSQYQSRIDSFDFDMVGQRYSMSQNMAPSLANFLGSEAAHMTGSLNLAGFANKAVDDLITTGLAAKTRDEMNDAGRAIDRIWRAGHYWVPNWNKPVHTIGVWSGFGRPEEDRLYDFQPAIWWWKEASDS
ncbi:extracellular solute-binding protein [Cohaesibacter haloalkalitolerans]|uniref:extracellular solute-binding protein n=1 Tax=Cohaesibacter haloalkalitolerans TaxID=1162980 RepID=UPI000E652E00|nr:extracellular solute-binding protein [Cohaesibacter haloalkalitolerans]